jgi:hypothetical protein
MVNSQKPNMCQKGLTLCNCYLHQIFLLILEKITANIFHTTLLEFGGDEKYEKTWETLEMSTLLKLNTV